MGNFRKKLGQIILDKQLLWQNPRCTAQNSGLGATCPQMLIDGEDWAVLGFRSSNVTS
jgi:hypothetical protein